MADGRLCRRVNSQLWNCSEDAESSRIFSTVFTFKLSRILEGRVSPTESWEAIDHGFRLGSLEDTDCLIFYFQELYTRPSTAERELDTYELCVDPATYYPKVMIRVDESIVNGQPQTVLYKEVERYFDINEPVEIQLPPA